MSTLNGYQLLEVIGGVDDALVNESLDFFCGGIEGGVLFPASAPKRPRRLLAKIAAAGLAAAMLCGAVTVVPLLGGPNLWQGFYGVVAPLFSPDETESEPEYECEEDATDRPDEPEDPDAPDNPNKWNPSGNNWGGGSYGTGGEPQRPEAPTVRDPSPEWPTVNIPNPRPETPTVPRPGVPGGWP